MCKIIDEVNNRIKHKCGNVSEGNVCECHTDTISVDDVICAVKQLKSGKKDCDENLYSDHIMHGSHKLYVLLSLLFSAMLTHGYCPANMLTGVMVPIPKVKGTVKSEEYRAITLGSIFAKLFDVIILNICQEKLQTSNLQFGLKKGSSTTACTFVVQEVVSLYNSRGSNVYCTLLDASKAFDRLDFCVLFRKLLCRNICSLFIRILLYIYVNQLLAVKWNSNTSTSFKVSNGVKQGGVISPSLFCLYIDDLLQKLSKCGIGCYVGPQYCGTLGYADDLVLICPTVSSTNAMLKICENYANAHSILFNCKKSQVIYFPCVKGTQPKGTLFLNNEKLLYVDKAKHLGHMLSNDVQGIVDLSYVKRLL